MKLQNRIEILLRLKEYLMADTEEWKSVKNNAFAHNAWFTPEFIDLSVTNIAEEFLSGDKLRKWVAHYSLDDNITPKM